VAGVSQAAAEAGIIAASVFYVLTTAVWALLAWELLAVAYIAAGLALAWSGERHNLGDASAVRSLRRWSWVLPLVSSIAGANSAVVALTVRADVGRDLDAFLLATAASVGVVLSWMLLQIGFAHIYQAIDATDPDARAIDFPGETAPSSLNYLYFSFAVGASFATSDASIRAVEVRRIVMVQSIVCFFYNALVVAVAFQVLQQVIS
jgi:uncharacterized membrane protein